MDIKFFNRGSNKLEVEKVYGDKFLKWLYTSKSGGIISPILCKATISRLYGFWQNTSFSSKKIAPFINEFNINMSEFLPQEGRDESSPYSNFNNFFARRIKDGVRKFKTEKNLLPAFAEARYFGFKEVSDEMSFPIKGKDYKASDFIANEKWAEHFKDGPMMIARLCPVDYHRFHFFDNGKILDQYEVKGELDSVNPIALKAKAKVLASNKREVAIIETENFGKVAYIEVGAICVGTIKQSYTGDSCTRGQEKGYFLFGGSTVVLLGEKGAWTPAEDIISKTNENIETYVQLGDTLAIAD